MFIRITQRPIGEAPEWVRDAWIGLRLPLVCERKGEWAGVAVLTGPRTMLGQWWAHLRGRVQAQDGYLVDTNTALAILAQASPAAAEWWRTWAPHLLGDGRCLIFDAEACQEDEAEA